MHHKHLAPFNPTCHNIVDKRFIKLLLLTCHEGEIIDLFIAKMIEGLLWIFNCIPALNFEHYGWFSIEFWVQIFFVSVGHNSKHFNILCRWYFDNILTNHWGFFPKLGTWLGHLQSWGQQISSGWSFFFYCKSVACFKVFILCTIAYGSKTHIRSQDVSFVLCCIFFGRVSVMGTGLIFICALFTYAQTFARNFLGLESSLMIDALHKRSEVLVKTKTIQWFSVFNYSLAPLGLGVRFLPLTCMRSLLYSIWPVFWWFPPGSPVSSLSPKTWRLTVLSIVCGKNVLGYWVDD